MGNRFPILVLAVAIIISILMVNTGRVYAASTLVQQSNTPFTITNATPSPFTMSLTFSSSVASGNVVLVGLNFDTLQSVVTAVTDTLGSSYSLVSSATNVAIYDTTLTSSGADTVHATLTLACAGHCSGKDAIYIFEVSGVQTAGAGTGSGSGLNTGVSTTPVTFQSGAFLLGMIFVECNGGPCTDTAGPGFTLVSAAHPSSEAQYATSGVTSPSTFPASHTDALGDALDALGEASVALNPIGTPIPPIPEYPFGLPILAIVAVLAYGLIKRKTRS